MIIDDNGMAIRRQDITKLYPNFAQRPNVKRLRQKQN